MNLIVTDQRISLYPSQEQGDALVWQLEAEDIAYHWDGTELVVWYTQITQEEVKSILCGIYQSEREFTQMHPEFNR